MNDKIIKVLVASPSYDGRFDVRYMDSLLKTQEMCVGTNIKILPYFLCYDSLIQRARNDYFKVAYESQVDVLFFIDSDIEWKPEDFIKLVKSDKDMIGGAYRKKTLEEELYAFKAKENEVDFDIVPDSDGLLEINGIGCGFLKLSRNCVVKLFESEKIQYRDNKNGNIGIIKNICECVVTDQEHFISEDIIMGYKWQQLGGKVYLDTTINCAHVGATAYTGDVAQWLKNWRISFDKNRGVEQSTPILSKYFSVPTDDEFKVL